MAQQFDVAARIAKQAPMRIIELEVPIKSPDKTGEEVILGAELKKNLDTMPKGRQVMFTLVLPGVADLYSG